MRLAKCPRCGELPDVYPNGWCDCCDWGAQSVKDWNRLARLVREGRKYQWLKRQSRTGMEWNGWLSDMLKAADEWWRKRRDGGGK